MCKMGGWVVLEKSGGGSTHSYQQKILKRTKFHRPDCNYLHRLIEAERGTFWCGSVTVHTLWQVEIKIKSQHLRRDPNYHYLALSVHRLLEF